MSQHCLQTGVSLTQILGYGSQALNRQLMVSARFLHHELPIRLAHRLVELNALPADLSNNIHLQRVKRW
jgi:pyruvate dehydrogenase kinase 2/3/4